MFPELEPHVSLKMFKSPAPLAWFQCWAWAEEEVGKGKPYGGLDPIWKLVSFLYE